MPRKRLKCTGEPAKNNQKQAKYESTVNTVNKEISGGDDNNDAAQLSR